MFTGNLQNPLSSETILCYNDSVERARQTLSAQIKIKRGKSKWQTTNLQ